LLLLWGMSMPYAAFYAKGSLEWSYPPGVERPEDAEAIVVLSGFVRPPDKTLSEAVLGENTFLRCMEAAKLYRQGKPCLVVVSGGKLNSPLKEQTFAEVMGEFLQTQGVAAEDILKEENSQTTYENARNTAALLKERGIKKIALVTSATHMRRSEACFRAQEFDVAAVACDHQATQFRWRLANLLPSPVAASDVQGAAHEWLGLFWYWLWGRA
jgi:uncharacterized SAM-binding protein YcdF (DUF218 family)